MAPKIEPCGTPILAMGAQYVFVMLTYCVLPDSYDEITSRYLFLHHSCIVYREECYL